MTFYIEAKNSKGIRRIEVVAITVEEAEEKAKNLLGEGYFVESISTFERPVRS
jgi:hypothetical protein|tara:strand:+ start:488 stop:646 length:159 start_codon:yes stop_codon:yes gene_type:complete